ncbi:hypothetical protein S7711_10860 [Stachybotrys chartarum IBT 7711]|uniref:Uncharacterized protein n=1 Tax=Stachybotrys chartarum (strain CBS 109288 / IBT 7711) TaxID=1280523 RepID=A0A084AUF6_STACB|nr:hypothetical protein S7711_10860 [Stachybotrys chartarum IBT 7711]
MYCFCPFLVALFVHAANSRVSALPQLRLGSYHIHTNEPHDRTSDLLRTFGLMADAENHTLSQYEARLDLLEHVRLLDYKLTSPLPDEASQTPSLYQDATHLLLGAKVPFELPAASNYSHNHSQNIAGTAAWVAAAAPKNGFQAIALTSKRGATATIAVTRTETACLAIAQQTSRPWGDQAPRSPSQSHADEGQVQEQNATNLESINSAHDFTVQGQEPLGVRTQADAPAFTTLEIRSTLHPLTVAADQPTPSPATSCILAETSLKTEVFRKRRCKCGKPNSGDFSQSMQKPMPKKWGDM